MILSSALTFAVLLYATTEIVSFPMFLRKTGMMSKKEGDSIPNNYYISTEAKCCKKRCIMLYSKNMTTIITCKRSQCKCIPYEEIPKNVTSLWMQTNDLTTLANSSFAVYTQLQKLVLKNNSLNYIASGAFAGLENLERLQLSYNPINVFRDFLFLPLRSLVFLGLQQTRIQEFNPNVLYHMPLLKGITLDHNYLTGMPDFLNDRNETALPRIENIRFNFNNLMALDANNFRGLETITKLNFGNNRIYTIERKCFSNLKRLKNLYLKNNYLIVIYESSFWSESIEILDLGDSNHFNLNSTTQQNFEFLPQLRKLFLRDCRIDYKSFNFTKLFRAFRNLTELDMSLTKLQTHTVVNFQYMTKMSVLKLTGNDIETLNSRYFQNMAGTLKELYIGTNKITTINSRSLPEEMWERLKIIDLSDNRWNCDCGIIWFRGWLRQNQEK